jgi:hypothetical protein
MRARRDFSFEIFKRKNPPRAQRAAKFSSYLGFI